MSERKYGKNKPTLTVNRAGLKNYFFYFGQRIQKQRVDINRVFLNYAGNKFGHSVKASLMAGDLVLTEIDERLLSMFKPEVGKDEHLKKL